MKSAENNNNRNKWLHAQVLSTSIKKVLKIKDSFPKLSLKKIKKIHKTINEPRKEKPCFNIKTKELSRKQVISLCYPLTNILLILIEY